MKWTENIERIHLGYLLVYFRVDQVFTNLRHFLLKPKFNRRKPKYLAGFAIWKKLLSENISFKNHDGWLVLRKKMLFVISFMGILIAFRNNFQSFPTPFDMVEVQLKTEFSDLINPEIQLAKNIPTYLRAISSKD